MGTNYYWRPKPACKSCGREYLGIHIGKSSAGWNFSLHIFNAIEYDNITKDIRNLADWKKLLKIGVIADEYGRLISYEDMIKEITEKALFNGKELKRHLNRTNSELSEETYDLIYGNFG